jgi:hypothetical protein
MFLASSVREAFDGRLFGPSVSTDQIAEAERVLGHELPPILRTLYGAFDGFAGPTNAPFMFPLLKGSAFSQESLVSFTLFLRGEDGFPVFLQRAVAVGDNGTGASWLILLDKPNEVVRWDAEWGDTYEVLEGPLLDVWCREKALYESLDQSS